VNGARRPRVLCVDDDAAVLAALRRMSRGEPYDLVTTDDPAEALEWIRGGTFDVLVTDQRMPGVTGAELAREARRVSPHMAVIVLTAYPDTALVLEREGSASIAGACRPRPLWPRFWGSWSFPGAAGAGRGSGSRTSTGWRARSRSSFWICSAWRGSGTRASPCPTVRATPRRCCGAWGVRRRSSGRPPATTSTAEVVLI